MFNFIVNLIIFLIILIICFYFNNHKHDKSNDYKLYIKKVLKMPMGIDKPSIRPRLLLMIEGDELFTPTWLTLDKMIFSPAIEPFDKALLILEYIVLDCGGEFNKNYATIEPSLILVKVKISYVLSELTFNNYSIKLMNLELNYLRVQSNFKPHSSLFLLIHFHPFFS